MPGDWLYAIGDVCGRALLTHMGKYQARIAGEVIAARAGGSQDLPSSAEGHRGLPQVVFTTPEVGSAGVTEEQAREAGIDIEVVEYDLGALAGTWVMRPDYRGRAKLVVDRADDIVIGATFVGRHRRTRAFGDHGDRRTYPLSTCGTWCPAIPRRARSGSGSWRHCDRSAMRHAPGETRWERG